MLLTQRERGFVWASATVALRGLEQELRTALRAREFARKSDTSVDERIMKAYNECSDLQEIIRVTRAHQNGEEVQTSHVDIIGLMAFTAQTLRVTPEEWQEAVKIKEKPRTL